MSFSVAVVAVAHEPSDQMGYDQQKQFYAGESGVTYRVAEPVMITRKGPPGYKYLIVGVVATNKTEAPVFLAKGEVGVSSTNGFSSSDTYGAYNPGSVWESEPDVPHEFLLIFTVPTRFSGEGWAWYLQIKHQSIALGTISFND
jgi:hypothetical protein